MSEEPKKLYDIASPNDTDASLEAIAARQVRIMHALACMALNELHKGSVGKQDFSQISEALSVLSGGELPVWESDAGRDMEGLK